MLIDLFFQGVIHKLGLQNLEFVFPLPSHTVGTGSLPPLVDNLAILTYEETLIIVYPFPLPTYFMYGPQLMFRKNKSLKKCFGPNRFFLLCTHGSTLKKVCKRKNLDRCDIDPLKTEWKFSDIFHERGRAAGHDAAGARPRTWRKCRRTRSSIFAALECAKFKVALRKLSWKENEVNWWNAGILQTHGWIFLEKILTLAKSKDKTSQDLKVSVWTVP